MGDSLEWSGSFWTLIRWVKTRQWVKVLVDLIWVTLIIALAKFMALLFEIFHDFGTTCFSTSNSILTIARIESLWFERFGLIPSILLCVGIILRRYLPDKIRRFATMGFLTFSILILAGAVVVLFGFRGWPGAAPN